MTVFADPPEIIPGGVIFNCAGQAILEDSRSLIERWANKNRTNNLQRLDNLLRQVVVFNNEDPDLIHHSVQSPFQRPQDWVKI